MVSMRQIEPLGTPAMTCMCGRAWILAQSLSEILPTSALLHPSAVCARIVSVMCRSMALRLIMGTAILISATGYLIPLNSAKVSHAS
jgi:hypothetical protein